MYSHPYERPWIHVFPPLTWHLVNIYLVLNERPWRRVSPMTLAVGQCVSGPYERPWGTFNLETDPAAAAANGIATFLAVSV